MVAKYSADSRFWRSPTPHETVFGLVKKIRAQTGARRRGYLYAASLYDDSDVFGSWGSRVGSNTEDYRNILSLNVVRPNTDTLTTQVAKGRPLPLPITSDGNYSQQRRARELGRLIEGQFIASNVWETNHSIIRDAVLFNPGFAYVWRDGSKIFYDRVFPWEVDCDPRDAMYGSPKTIHLTRLVDKLVLAEMYPRHKTDIEASDQVFDDYIVSSMSMTADTVVVIESWHLPSGPDADDGYHTICISNATLKKEKYNYDRFPIIPLYMMPPLTGYYGLGFGRMLTGIQYTVNMLAERMQEQAELAPCMLAVANGSDIQIDSLGNTGWQVMTYNQGFSPVPIQPPPFNPAMLDFMRQTYNFAFDQTGVSQIAAQAELPAALKEASGVAIQLHNENRSERFYVMNKLYEQFCVNVAWRMIDLFEEMANDKRIKKIGVTVPARQAGRRILTKLDYRNVRLDREEFTLDIFPTSMLKQEPTMRAAQVESWANAGWISPEDAKMLLEFPDIDRVSNMSRARYEIVDQIMEHFLDEAVDPNSPDAYIPPEPLFDLNLCIQKGMQAYLRSKLDGVEEERLQLIRDFILDSQDLMRQAQQAAAPPPGAPVAMGPEPAMPPPAAPPAEGGLTPADLAAAAQSGAIS